MKTEFVTIWSSSGKGRPWLIDRTHSIEYARTIVGYIELRQVVSINNRLYTIMPVDSDPNKLRDSLTDKICAARGFAKTTGSNPVPSALLTGTTA